MTVDELKSVIHEVTTEDMEAWRETFEITVPGDIVEFCHLFFLPKIPFPLTFHIPT